MVLKPTEKFIQLNPVTHLYYFLSNYCICACYTSCKYLYFYIIFLIQLLSLYLPLFRGLLRRPWSSVNILFAICTSHIIHLVCPYVSPQMSGLLAVRLFYWNPSSSYLIQRDCKPRRYYYNKELRPDEKSLVSRGFAAHVLKFRVQ